MLPIETKELTIRKTPLYFIVAVFIVYLYVLEQSGKFTFANYLAAGGMLLLLFIYYVLTKNKLIIDNDGITQQLFFRKQRELKWNEIKSSKLEWEYHMHGANLGWITTPFIGKAIRFETWFYSRKKLKLIAEALVQKCNTADIDKKIISMAEGKFPWYIF